MRNIPDKIKRKWRRSACSCLCSNPRFEKHNCPDVVWGTPHFIYVVECRCPFGRNTKRARDATIAKYNPLVCELHRILHKPVALVPVVISRTGVVADEVAADFASLPMDLAVGSLQEIAARSSSGLYGPSVFGESHAFS